MEMMILMGMDIELPAVRRQIAAGLDLMVHLGRMRDKSRRVLEILEISGYDTVRNEIQTHLLYEFEETGCDENGRLQGSLKRKGTLTNTLKIQRAGLMQQYCEITDKQQISDREITEK